MNTTRTSAYTAIRSFRTARAPVRTLHASVARKRAVEDSPLSHNTPPKRGLGPWPMAAGLTALLGGIYWYYTTAESQRIDVNKRELERRAAEPGRIAEEAKIRAQEAARDARNKTQEGAYEVRDA